MNAFAAVAIIIAAFFIAGLLVGFLIVMSLPVLASRRRADVPPAVGGRWDDHPDGADDDRDDLDGPPGMPWWRRTR